MIYRATKYSTHHNKFFEYIIYADILPKTGEYANFIYIDLQTNTYEGKGEFFGYSYELITDPVLVQHYSECFSKKEYYPIILFPLNILIKNILQNELLYSKI